ncbi:MAG: bifunctional DNA-formamidopyrimidine glycosylase/DNA-(apurinic or apyrimidinic site) lyase [Gemmatimonadota bacterium]|nr:bifunctional DNA-formamidopyrimidine glycosylase/DNA-(apurinic or apyrimidinic site) lyase [Gemmatimonadota bacterium]
MARDLDREVGGLRITGVTVLHRDVLREITARQLAQRVTDARILRVWRRAKLVVLDLSTGDRLVVQPRFTGALLLDAGALPERERRYATLSFHLGDGRTLHYRDIRRLGTVALMTGGRFAEYTAALGAEPLDPGFTVAHLSGVLRASRQAIKKVLMDQRHLAGVGNIYANEALWRAGVDPSRAADALTEPEVAALYTAITGVLRQSIAARGTSFRDYVDAAGQPGAFGRDLAAYGRGGEPCQRCGARLIETSAVDGRQTVFCARCQR